MRKCCDSNTFRKAHTSPLCPLWVNVGFQFIFDFTFHKLFSSRDLESMDLTCQYGPVAFVPRQGPDLCSGSSSHKFPFH